MTGKRGPRRAGVRKRNTKKAYWGLVFLLLLLVASGLAGCTLNNGALEEAVEEEVEEAFQPSEPVAPPAPPAPPDEVLLDVPALSQRPILPTGCELVSATMLLQYLGVPVGMEDVAQNIPYAGTPEEGYVGDPYGTGGYTIWPEPLASALSTYYPGLVGRTGDSLESLQQSLAEGIPVVVWVSDLHGFYLHSVLVTGYGPGVIYVNDPWTGEKDVPLQEEYFVRI